MDYREELQAYQPVNEQEAKDKEVTLSYLSCFGDNLLTRENEFAHFSASSMIFNKERTKVLMAFHNIYNSWSWTGGHADGERDFLALAMREAMEETGVSSLTPITAQMASIEILPVWGHMKRGKYVSSHQHINFSYLLEADESEALKVKEDENSAVGWIEIDKLLDYVSEPEMLPIYNKLIDQAKKR
ncbi:MAG: NUDIX domain-containing protein [Lachnospiraceae bacterium]|nr:NUDIX domain-containing protein [Lachnospiraceae bacterium]